MADNSVASPNAAAPLPLRMVLNGLDRLSRLDGWLGATCLALLTLLLLAEVSLRALSRVLPFLPAHIPVAWEWGSYLMAATFTFGAAMTLRSGGHIRVALLLSNVPSPLRRLLEVGSAAVACVFMTFLTWSMIRFTMGSFERGTTSISSNTPVWIPQAVVCFGIGLLAVQFLARFIQALLGLPLEDHRLKVAAASE
jgi:TRAP-type C4-dicarboxylate transport system permease small subunit